ncbi:MAG TPA: pyridoxamine 5'-phosphate oxidase family protein [Acidimicrobiales bacterium]|nr:pyridoxamine 5'-phosphate oxidase family protein [Acidimicrobiales bacterium]
MPEVGRSGRAEYPPTDRTVPSRHRERARYDAESVHAILDEGLVAHVGYVVDGRPRVIPMLYVRLGEALYLHGSTGARLNRTALRDREAGVEVSAEVTLFDALVLARASFNHSVNYRSVVVSGRAAPVLAERRKAEVLDALVERLVAGRGRDARPPTPEELRQTGVLELPLEEVSAKVRSGDPVDDEDDLGRSCWAGCLPLAVTFGAPQPSGDLDAGVELPDYLAALPRTALA